jgi:alpha-N-arabinofuranosidase
MANLAQTINVLQALILTDKEKMLLTPTYHVFDLYQVHQDAALLPVQFTSPDYVSGTDKLPAINMSASKDKQGKVHLTITNIDATHAIPLQLTLAGINFSTVEGKILTSPKFTDINTFVNPGVVKPAVFKNATLSGNVLQVQMPPLSVVALELK